MDPSTPLNDQSTYEFSDEESDFAPPPRKKRRSAASSKSAGKGRKDVKGKGKLRGKTGRLAFILESPTEIVLEILSYLMPVDILNLSYVDKELRTLLTSPTSNSVWVAARRNVPGLPDCPPDMTEAGYARLLFLKSCEMCGGIARGLSEMADIRIRLCGRCTKSQCIDGIVARRLLGVDRRSNDKVDLVPRHSPNGNAWFMFKHERYFKPAVSALARKLSKFSDPEELTKWQDEQREFVNSVTEHAALLQTYLRNSRDAADVKSQAVRERRLERLVELGYDRRDMKSYEFLHHRVVCQNADLTDRTWPNVLRHIEGIVQGVKAERQARELLERNTEIITGHFQLMLEAIPPGIEKQTFPPLPDLLDLPSVQPFLAWDGTSQGLCDLFNAELDSVEQEIADLRAHMKSGLAQLWRNNGASTSARASSSTVKGDVVADGELLSLATTVFSCMAYRCTEPIHFSSALVHPLHYSYFSSVPFDDPPMSVGANELGRNKWSSTLSRLAIKQQCKDAMSTIISAAELDEKTATVADLDAVGLHFRTYVDEKESEAMTWRAVYRILMAQPPPVHQSHGMGIFSSIASLAATALFPPYYDSDDDSYDSYDELYDYMDGPWGDHGYASDITGLMGEGPPSPNPNPSPPHVVVKVLRSTGEQE